MKRTTRVITIEILIELFIPARYAREVSNVAIHIRQFSAPSERPVTDINYRVGDDDAGQSDEAFSQRVEVVVGV